MLAVSRKRPVRTLAGIFRAGVAHGLSKQAWQRLSAGARGHRFYDLGPGGGSAGELVLCRCYSARPVPLSSLVKVAGRRWTVEETFHAAECLAGLDEHKDPALEVLAPLDHPGQARARLPRGHRRHRTSQRLVITRTCPLTCEEIQRLFAALPVQSVRDLAYRLR